MKTGQVWGLCDSGSKRLLKDPMHACRWVGEIELGCRKWGCNKLPFFAHCFKGKSFFPVGLSVQKIATEKSLHFQPGLRVLSVSIGLVKGADKGACIHTDPEGGLGLEPLL